MKSLSFALVVIGMLVATSAAAQRPQSAGRAIPRNLRPPPGMCRIWLDGVPASRQPAPTDCASALRNRPATAQVIFGDDYLSADSGARIPLGRSPLKGLAPLPNGLEHAAPDSVGHAHLRVDSLKKTDPHRGGSPTRPDSLRTHPDSSTGNF